MIEAQRLSDEMATLEGIVQVTESTMERALESGDIHSLQQAVDGCEQVSGQLREPYKGKLVELLGEYGEKLKVMREKEKKEKQKREGIAE